MPHLSRAVFGCFIFFFSVFQVTATAATRDTQRQQFQQAMGAIAADDMARFYALEAELRSYVLHGHLRFALAERAIEQGGLEAAKRKAVNLEKEFHGTFIAWRLMRAYRQRLRDEEQWQLFLDSGALPSTPKMLCETLRAKEVLGTLSSSDPDLLPLWDKRSWEGDCDWVMQRQLAAGQVSAKYLWKHVYALLNSGRLTQATAFKQHFNRRDQALIQAWIEGHTEPAVALADKRWHDDSELNRRVFKHLISRLSRSDAVAARRYWAEAHQLGRYDGETRHEAARTLSLRAASDYEAEALKWLRWLPVEAQDKASREARDRLAVRLGEWQEVRDAIEVMSAAERELSDWRYWDAVAKDELGLKAESKAALSELADTRSYYGFLAADRVAKPYKMHDLATPQNSVLRKALQSRADVQRMREYLFVGMRGEALAEWKALLRVIDAEQRAELSLIALDWGWYDRAIVTNGRTAYNDDLRVRFPFAYQKTVQEQSALHNLAVPWVYGVARRESLFQPEVRSGAGAIGLMQMMPATAKDVSRRAGKKLYTGALEDPEFNISLGTFYLRYLLDRFDDQQVMATAAYNAGLSRVPRWLADEAMSADRWVESIPFRETRDYVKAVMAYATVYDWRSDGRVDTRLSERMPPLPAGGESK